MLAPHSPDPANDLTLDQQIAFCCAPPVPEQPEGIQSRLYLLRREIQSCLVGDPLFPNEYDALAVPDRHQRICATCLVIWAGIDLLAKFYGGSDAQNESGPRFKKFVKENLLELSGLPEDLAALAPEILYTGLRNPMVHSFGLNSQKSFNVYLGTGNTGYFLIAIPGASNTYAVSVGGLYKAFLDSINTYRRRLAEAPLREAFGKMFSVYGSIGVGWTNARLDSLPATSPKHPS